MAKGGVLVRVTIVMKCYNQKQARKEIWFTCIPHHTSSLKLVKKGAGADAEAMEKSCLLACSP